MPDTREANLGGLEDAKPEEQASGNQVATSKAGTDLREKLLDLVPCVDYYCDKRGTSVQGDLNNDPEPVQCQFCYEQRFPAVDALMALVRQVEVEARVDELKRVFHSPTTLINSFYLEERFEELKALSTSKGAEDGA